MTLPQKIGRYEIKAELGRGGMATVYHGYDPRFEREVAIKFLPQELVHADPQFRVRFEREAKIIAKLEHPSIVPVYDVGEENGQPYFVMRFMRGGSLSDRIKAGAIGIEEGIGYLMQIAPGLDEAHSKGIIHRDLKPGNILFTAQKSAMISDFGIAKFSMAESGNMTGSAIIGTPAYLSPEQASGDTVDGRTDIYALGVILFEMMTGRQPYQADTPLALALKHLTEPVPHILEINPDLPAWMEKVISSAMAKNPADRFATAAEMVDMIHACLHGEIQSSIVTPTQKISPFNKTTVSKSSMVPTLISRGKKRNSIPLMAALALAGIGALIYWVGRPYFPPAVETPSATRTAASDPATLPPASAEASPVFQPPTQEPAPIVTDTPFAATLPILGGADKIAFVRHNELWMMNMDASDYQQLTTDGVEKFNLQWLPDGKTLLYMSGKTVKTVDTETLREETVFANLSAEYFESFQVSPDGKQAALVLNRELFVVPYDLEKLKHADRKSALLDMKGCLFYQDLAVKGAKWSSDGTRLAVKYIANDNGKFADAIRLLDIQSCGDALPTLLDNFPNGRFGFASEIVNYGYDGDGLFLLNSDIRNDGFGELAFYNSFTHKYEPVAPYEGNCCYRDAVFSPDGTHVLFAFQDIRLGGESPTHLYYLRADTLNQPRTLPPLNLADDFFSRLDAPMPALRPVQP